MGGWVARGGGLTLWWGWGVRKRRKRASCLQRQFHLNRSTVRVYSIACLHSLFYIARRRFLLPRPRVYNEFCVNCVYSYLQVKLLRIVGCCRRRRRQNAARDWITATILPPVEQLPDELDERLRSTTSK